MSLAPQSPSATLPADLFLVTRARFSRWAIPGGHLLLLWHCLGGAGRLLNPVVRPAFLRQVYFIGVLGLRAVALLALVVGSLAVTEGTQLLGARNDYLYVILGWALVTEVAPLFVAVVVLGRSATVIATELALMKVRGELRFLEHMRIDPRDYLVLPRIAALTVSLLALTVYFQVIAVTGGFAASALLLNVSFEEQMGYMLEAITPFGVAMAGVKSLIFGLVIGTIASFSGLYAGNAMSDVRSAQVTAYMRSLIWLVALDFLFAVAAFAL